MHAVCGPYWEKQCMRCRVCGIGPYSRPKAQCSPKGNDQGWQIISSCLFIIYGIALTTTTTTIVYLHFHSYITLQCYVIPFHSIPFLHYISNQLLCCVLIKAIQSRSGVFKCYRDNSGTKSDKRNLEKLSVKSVECLHFTMFSNVTESLKSCQR